MVFCANLHKEEVWLEILLTKVAHDFTMKIQENVFLSRRRQCRKGSHRRAAIGMCDNILPRAHTPQLYECSQFSVLRYTLLDGEKRLFNSSPLNN